MPHSLNLKNKLQLPLMNNNLMGSHSNGRLWSVRRQAYSIISTISPFTFHGHRLPTLYIVYLQTIVCRCGCSIILLVLYVTVAFVHSVLIMYVLQYKVCDLEFPIKYPCYSPVVISEMLYRFVCAFFHFSVSFIAV